MSADLRFAFVLAIAAIFVAVAAMVAPLYFVWSRTQLAILFWVGLVVAVGLFIYAFIVASSGGNMWSHPGNWLPGFFMIVFALGLVVSTVFFVRYRLQTSPQGSSTSTTTVGKNDFLISIKCFPSPPPRYDQPNTNNNLYYMFTETGAEKLPLKMIKSYSVTGIWGADINISTTRCIVTNYGPDKIANIHFDLHVTVQDVTRQNNGVGSGNIIGSYTFSISDLDFQSGTEQTAVFYAYNTSNLFLNILLPGAAKVFFAGSTSPENVRLIVRSDADNMYLLWPPVSGQLPTSQLPQIFSPPNMLK